MVCALVMGLLQPVVVSQKVKKIIPGHSQVVLGYAIFGICIILLALANQLFFVLLLIGLLATGGAFITPNITSLISLKGGEEAGEALGIQKSTDSLGQVIGPIAGKLASDSEQFVAISTDRSGGNRGGLIPIKKQKFCYRIWK